MTTTTTARPATSARPTNGRQALIQGLRDLAAFLHDNPDLPVNGWQEIAYCVHGDGDAAGLANLAGIAAAAGVDVTDTGGAPVTADTTHFEAKVRFGPIVYRATYILRDAMADYTALMSYSGTIRADRQDTADAATDRAA